MSDRLRRTTTTVRKTGVQPRAPWSSAPRTVIAQVATYLDPVEIAQVDEAARALGETRAAFVRRALEARVRTWQAGGGA